jgi:hypothetical protein
VPGQTFITSLKTTDVGQLTGIKLRSTTSKPYYCIKVKVEVGPRMWVFDCDGELQCPDKCAHNMQLSGNYFGNLGQAEYKIEVFNSDQECKIPVFVQLVGSQDMSVKKVNINQHFRF